MLERMLEKRPVATVSGALLFWAGMWFGFVLAVAAIAEWRLGW